ncbi:hypothetical protein L1987_24040 [Smallanthus sonchifolius]|uniref:Uncharacterized protein n=1 Tax=Smallanthus sonchifolius TaxID=185202 RepID=A0ACB9IJX8_9ASTR|nr:hypothetical protein L1987_24040 [Smallanthus sonchifolius]
MITDDYDTNTTAAATHEESKETSENSRKFECHYCCRNFPTSQALGVHQNSHKRERQHAKQAHLQSTMVNVSFSEAQMYGLMNDHRFNPPPFYHHTNPNSTITNYNHRDYGTTSSHQTPITGGPLALWRYQNAQNSTFNRNHSINLSPMISANECLQASRIPTSSSDIYESKSGVQDHVSLDLHL